MLDSIKGGIRWVSVFSILQMIANMALVIALARLLTPSEVGGFALALVILTFLQVFAQIGIDAAIVQIEDANGRVISTAFTMVLVASTSMTVIGLVGISAWHPKSYPNLPLSEDLLATLSVLLISMPMLAIAGFLEAIFNRDLAFKVPSITGFASFMLGYAACSIGLAALGFGANALAIAYVIQQAMRAVLLFVMLKKRPILGFHCQDALRILRFGVGFSIAKIGNVLALQADNLIVGTYLGDAALGLYSRAYQLVMSPIGLIATVVDRVLFPAMSRKQNDITLLRQAFLLSSSAIFALFSPLSLVLFEFRDEIIMTVLGSTWSAASGPFGYLAIGLSFRAAYRLSDIVSRARGLVYRRALVQWIYAALTVTGGIVGSRWGLDGVAMGVSGAIAVNWLLMTLLTTNSLNIDLVEMLASIRPGLFTLSLTYLAIIGVDLARYPVEPTRLMYAAFAVLLAIFMVQYAWSAVIDWKNLLQRMKSAT